MLFRCTVHQERVRAGLRGWKGVPQLVLCCLFSVSFLPVFAQFNYPDFSSTTGLVLNGNAARSGNRLRLTPAAGSQLGSAWFEAPQVVTAGFRTTFQFQITEPPPWGGADGFSFNVQNDSTCTVVGEDGTLGDFAVSFDTWDNGFPEPGDNFVEIFFQGASVAVQNLYDLGIDMSDGNVHSVEIVYDAGTATVTVRIDTQVVASVAGIDLSSLSPALVGFGARTGGAWENHDILNWCFMPLKTGTKESFVRSACPRGVVPGLALVGTAAPSADRLRLTPALGGRQGSAWYETAQSVSAGFETTFQFQIRAQGNAWGGPEGGADGFSFSVQNDGTSLSVGEDGATGDFAVSFDTWNNGFPEPSDNFVEIFYLGSSVAVQDLYSLGINLSDGATHTVTINYDAGTATVTVRIDTRVVASVAGIDLSSLSPAYVGFGARTGGAWEDHDILNWSFAPTTGGGFNYPRFGEPIPGLVMLAAAAPVVGNLRLTPAAGDQYGSAWYETPQNVSAGFQTTFQFKITNSTFGGADGFSFNVQNDRLDLVVGEDGARGDLAISFDTWFNDGEAPPEPSENFVEIFYSGFRVAVQDLNLLGINLSDGATHTVTINYDGNADRVEVRIDSTLVASADFIDLSFLSPAYVGFGARTGGAWENHDILNWSFAPTTGGGFNYDRFGTVEPISGVTMVGNAAQAGDLVRLTPAAAGQIGSAWFTNPFNVSGGFGILFQFQITGVTNGGADGFSFNVQNDGLGTLVGEDGTTGDFSVSFDTWNNGFPEPSDNFVEIFYQGSSVAVQDLYLLGINLSDGNVHTAAVDFDRATGTVSVAIDGVLVASATGIDLSFLGPAFVGWGARTGGAWETHDILNWSFITKRLLGDVNGDYVVDNVDLSAILSRFAQTGGNEDVNGDGRVDDKDLGTGLVSHGVGCP